MPIYEPPSGYDDLLADAEDAADRGEFRDIEVPGVGVVRVRKPMPKSAAMLAMSVCPVLKTDPDAPALDVEERKSALAVQQRSYIKQFVREHLADGEYERLILEMMDPDRDMPIDVDDRVARCIATCGTARPYGAVLGLTLGAAQNWRALRYKIQTCGIVDPMALPTLHSLLDHFEQLALESFDHDDKGKQEREQFIGALYRPDLPMVAAAATARGKRVKPPAPPGFSPAENRRSFAAFARAAR